MRQKIRKGILLILFLAFPVVMNYFSPYVPMVGAAQGLVTMSLVMFLFMGLTALFFGRAWCAWVCPVSGLHEYCLSVRDKSVPVKKLRIIRYAIFALWLGLLAAMFVLAGGIKGFRLLYLTENGISVDEPMKYIIYYAVLLILVVLNLALGRRGACHALCWMSPFLTAGYHIGRRLHLPQLRVRTRPQACTSCGKCTRICQMSLPVQESVPKMQVAASECILCGQCVDGCPGKALYMGFKNKP